MMKKNTFLTHLNTLSLAEVKKFGRHLKANSADSKLLLKAYDYYVKFHKKTKPSYEPEEVFQKIFSRKLTSKADLRNLNNFPTDLLAKLKEYLIQKKVMETKFEKDFLWLQVLEERGLSHQRALQFKKVKKEQNKAKDIWSSLNQLKLYNHEYFRNNFEKEDTKTPLIEDGIQSLNDFYISFHLKYAFESLNRKNILTTKPSSNPLLNAVISLIEKKQINTSPTNELYFELYQFSQERTYPKFIKLRTFLFDNVESLAQEEKLITLLSMINYIAGELKTGRHELAIDIFELYKFGIENDKILIHNGILDSVNFRSIVNIACNLKQFDWVENFIADYQIYLEPKVRLENVAIANSMLFFEQGKFEEVIENVEKYKFSEVNSTIISRIYELKSKYELSKYENLDSETESFIRFVKRSKNQGDANKLAASQFGRILIHLFQRKLSKDKLMHEIQTTALLYSRGWLVEKQKGYQPFTN